MSVVGGASVLLVCCAVFLGGCTALVIAGGAGSPSASKSEAAQAADERISASVRAELQADRIIAGSVIEVSTENGVVTLQGSVASYSVRSQAEALTAGVAGVRGIINRLKIKRTI